MAGQWASEKIASPKKVKIIEQKSVFTMYLICSFTTYQTKYWLYKINMH